MATIAPNKDESETRQHWPKLTRFASLPLSAICIHFINHPWPVEHWSCQAFWIIAAGGMFLCLASMFHEAAHRTLSPFGWFDVFFGKLLGTLMFVPYTTYRETHVRHHAYLNTPEDFELWPYSDPTKSLSFRRAFVLFDLILAGPAAAIIYGRTFFHSSSPIRSESIRRAIAIEYVGMAVFWAVILGVVVTTNSLADFVLLWLLPQMVSSSLQAGRKMTEHLGMKSYDPLLGTRTVIGSNWLMKAYSFLNFEIFIHGPHHRHPKASHSDLERCMHDYMREQPNAEFPVYSSYWSAFWAMLPSVWRNPGVGMNCGMPAPNSSELKLGRDDSLNVQANQREQTPVSRAA